MGYKFNKEKTFKGGASLPAGGYICEIMSAPIYRKWNGSDWEKVEKFEDADQTAIPFDIVEGEFAGYYQKKYDNDDTEGKKWKGWLRLSHPKDSDKYDTNEKKYNSFGVALMESNDGFEFDINKNKALKGLKLGIVFREEGFEKQDGTIGYFAAPYTTYSVDDIKSGNFKVPNRYVKDSLVSKAQASIEAESSDAFTSADDEECPFE